MMADHEVILQALRILEAIIAEIYDGKTPDTRDMHALLTFLREFADGSHHVKEEAILFPALIQTGMTLQEGPLRIMSFEHERGRALASAMEDALSRKDYPGFAGYARRYVELLGQHIEKENYALFDLAERALTDEEDQRIADAFQEFEQNIVGRTTYEKMHGMIESLAAKYATPAASVSR